MMRLVVLILVLLLTAGSALSQDWNSYANSRFSYVIDIPPGFSGEGEADNGDGQIFNSDDGTQLLRVYGGNSPDGFETTVASAMQQARDGGWTLSYERVTPSWASFSGTRNGIVVYARAIALCAGTQFASFELQYPERDLEKMHAVVERLVDSLASSGEGESC
jgi:hypothetical protein